MELAFEDFGAGFRGLYQECVKDSTRTVDFLSSDTAHGVVVELSNEMEAGGEKVQQDENQWSHWILSIFGGIRASLTHAHTHTHTHTHTHKHKHTSHVHTSKMPFSAYRMYTPRSESPQYTFSKCAPTPYTTYNDRRADFLRISTRATAPRQPSRACRKRVACIHCTKGGRGGRGRGGILMAISPSS